MDKRTEVGWMYLLAVRVANFRLIVFWVGTINLFEGSHFV